MLPARGPPCSPPPLGKDDALDTASGLSSVRSFRNHPAHRSDKQPGSDSFVLNYALVLQSPNCKGHQAVRSGQLLTFWYRVNFAGHSSVTGR